MEFLPKTFLICISAMISSAVCYAENISATIVDFGEILPYEDQSSFSSNNSHNGMLFEMPPEHVPTFKESEDKSRISIKLGTQFGILVQVDGGPDLGIAGVKTRWTHPKFSDGATVEEWPSPMNYGYARYAGWVIEDEGEMVPGEWKVEILHKGRVLASQIFNIQLSDSSSD